MSDHHVELENEPSKIEDTPITPQTANSDLPPQGEPVPAMPQQAQQYQSQPIIYQQGQPIMPQQYPQNQQQQGYYQPQFMYVPPGQNQSNFYPQQQYMQMPIPGQMMYPVSRYSQTLNCKNCRKPVESMVHYELGNGTYIVGGLLCMFGLSLGCCLIPSFMEECKDALHFCPYCGNQIGVKKFLFE